ncbi:MAG TPA: peptidase [Cellulomonas sp.]
MTRMRQVTVALVAGLALALGATPAFAGTASSAAVRTATDEATSDGTASDDSTSDGATSGSAASDETASDDTACRSLAAGYTASTPCQLVIEVAQGVCMSDTPVLQYSVAPEGTPNTTVTITWINPDGDNIVQADLPLTGEVLWPGTVVENGVVVDWPGWTRNADGTYTEGDEYTWTRTGVQILFQVNPSATTIVAYPPATSLCAGPVQSEVLAVDPSDPEATTTSAVLADDPGTGLASSVLAATGLTAGPALAIGVALLGGGALLVLLAARRRRQARHAS